MFNKAVASFFRLKARPISLTYKEGSLMFLSRKAKCLSKKLGKPDVGKEIMTKVTISSLGVPGKTAAPVSSQQNPRAGLRSRHPENQVIIKDRVYISCFGHEK